MKQSISGSLVDVYLYLTDILTNVNFLYKIAEINCTTGFSNFLEDGLSYKTAFVPSKTSDSVDILDGEQYFYIDTNAISGKGINLIGWRENTNINGQLTLKPNFETLNFRPYIVVGQGNMVASINFVSCPLPYNANQSFFVNVSNAVYKLYLYESLDNGVTYNLKAKENLTGILSASNYECFAGEMLNDINAVYYIEAYDLSQGGTTITAQCGVFVTALNLSFDVPTKKIQIGGSNCYQFLTIFESLDGINFTQFETTTLPAGPSNPNYTTINSYWSGRFYYARTKNSSGVNIDTPLQIAP